MIEVIRDKEGTRASVDGTFKDLFFELTAVIKTMADGSEGRITTHDIAIELVNYFNQMAKGEIE